jgi:hypothetical protein
MKLKNYTFEFLSIFVAVISAFALNNWNDNQRDREAESKILSEIYNGLEKDLHDVHLNTLGHEQGIRSCQYWRKVVDNEDPEPDSLINHYFSLCRDFVSIQNTSGYEALKSRGFELIKNDSLRTNIISLYEFDYQTLEKLEEEYDEIQFHQSYFKELNAIIAPHLEYDSIRNISGINLPMNLSEDEKKVFISYLWKISVNRKFILQVYRDVEDRIKALRMDIENELTLAD